MDRNENPRRSPELLAALSRLEQLQEKILAMNAELDVHLAKCRALIGADEETEALILANNQPLPSCF